MYTTYTLRSVQFLWIAQMLGLGGSKEIRVIWRQRVQRVVLDQRGQPVIRAVPPVSPPDQSTIPR